MAISFINNAEAAEVFSVIDKKPEGRIEINGAGLLNADFIIGGVLIPSSCVDNISDAEQHLSYCSELASAIPFPGSYKGIINNLDQFAFFVNHAVTAISPPPPINSSMSGIS